MQSIAAVENKLIPIRRVTEKGPGNAPTIDTIEYHDKRTNTFHMCEMIRASKVNDARIQLTIDGKYPSIEDGVLATRLFDAQLWTPKAGGVKKGKIQTLLFPKWMD